MGYTYGGMLGIFLLAVLTKKRGNDILNAVIMFSSILVVIALTSNSFMATFSVKALAWPWAIVIGTVYTFGVASIFRGKPVEQDDPAYLEVKEMEDKLHQIKSEKSGDRTYPNPVTQND